MTTVNVINVSKVIKKNVVLKNINLDLLSGNVIGFEGINGSGKTMLMRIICGLIEPTEGKVFINGKELQQEISFPPSIGVMLENPSFLASYSGFENLNLLAEVKKIIGADRINAVLDEVGLGDAKKKKYRKYSLGMKQRLGIAAAIMEEPDIVILDEPTNSLDEDGVEMVKSVVKKQRERGALVILSCHEAPVLYELSDEIYKISKGEITDHKTAGENEDES